MANAFPLLQMPPCIADIEGEISFLEINILYSEEEMMQGNVAEFSLEVKNKKKQKKQVTLIFCLF